MKRGVFINKIILTTESGADIPDDLAKRYNIQIVPMHIIMNGRSYLDGELHVQGIFDYHDHTKGLAQTTATSTKEYIVFFTKVRTEYPDCVIIHIGYTSKASLSYRNAISAAKKFDDIYLIDTLNVTAGLAAIVLYAADVLEKDSDIEISQLVQRIEAVIPKSRLAFIPGDLDYLKAGGRVSNAGFLGSEMLRVKPRLELIEGKLFSTQKYRGKMKDVSKKMMEDYLKQYNINRDQLYFIYSLGLEESIIHEMNDLAELNGFDEIRWIEAGSVISSHVGPGAFGIAGLEV